MFKSLLKFFSKKEKPLEEVKDFPPAQSPVVDVVWPNRFKYERYGDLKYFNFTDFVQSYPLIDYIFASVNLLASSIRQFDIEILQKDESGVLKEVEDSELGNLIKYPNRSYGYKDLLEGTALSLAITGNAYWEIVKVNDEAVGLYLLQPHRIIIERNPKTNELIYKYLTSPKQPDVIYTEDEIIHFKLINLQDDFYGLSPLVAAQLPANVARKALQMLDSYFENGGIFKGVLETDKFLPPNAYEQLKSRLAELYQGFRNAFKIPILEGGLKYKQIQVHPKDSQAIEANEQAMLKILSIFRTPPELLGFRPVNRAALDDLRRMYWEDTVKPFATKIEEILNIQKHKFTSGEEKDYIIKLDYTNIEALKGNELSRARIAAMLVDRGILTINEARERFFNLKPTPYGDMALLPLNMLQVDADRKPENLPGGQGGNALAYTEPELKAKENKSIAINYKQEVDFVRQWLEVNIGNDISQLFIEEFVGFISKVKNYLGDNLDKEELKRKIVNYFDGQVAVFEDEVYHMLRNKLFGLATSLVIKRGFETVPENIFKDLDEFASAFSVVFFKWINNTTKKRLVEIIEEGNDFKSIIEGITKEFNKVIMTDGARLKTIYRTESNRILNFVLFSVHKHLGYKYKTWHCWDVKNSRHSVLSGVKIKIDEEFDVNGEKALFPCDPNLSADNSVNCKCYLVYSFDS